MKIIQRVLFFLPVMAVLFFACNEKSTGDRVEKIYGKAAKQKFILLVYTGGLPGKYADTAAAHLKRNFGLDVKTEKLGQFPENLRSLVHKGRYRADSILKFLQQRYHDRAVKVLLLTQYDISTTKYSNRAAGEIKKPVNRYRDWAIFGLGACPGYCCVVSVNRLRARKATEKTFVQRVKNITVHEVGHTFGLPHCATPRCVMNDANETILTVDHSTGTFCEKCRFFLHH